MMPRTKGAQIQVFPVPEDRIPGKSGSALPRSLPLALVVSHFDAARPLGRILVLGMDAVVQQSGGLTGSGTDRSNGSGRSDVGSDADDQGCFATSRSTSYLRLIHTQMEGGWVLTVEQELDAPELLAVARASASVISSEGTREAAGGVTGLKPPGGLTEPCSGVPTDSEPEGCTAAAAVLTARSNTKLCVSLHALLHGDGGRGGGREDESVVTLSKVASSSVRIESPFLHLSWVAWHRSHPRRHPTAEGGGTPASPGIQPNGQQPLGPSLGPPACKPREIQPTADGLDQAVYHRVQLMIGTLGSTSQSVTVDLHTYPTHAGSHQTSPSDPVRLDTDSPNISSSEPITTIPPDSLGAEKQMTGSCSGDFMCNNEEEEGALVKLQYIRSGLTNLRVWAVSADGTPVPMSLVYKQDPCQSSGGAGNIGPVSHGGSQGNILPVGTPADGGGASSLLPRGRPVLMQVYGAFGMLDNLELQPGR